MEGIAKRFETIMDKYLTPAGYEFQKAQQEFERVQKGKELFDKDIVSHWGVRQTTMSSSKCCRR